MPWSRLWSRFSCAPSGSSELPLFLRRSGARSSCRTRCGSLSSAMAEECFGGAGHQHAFPRRVVVLVLGGSRHFAADTAHLEIVDIDDALHRPYFLEEVQDGEVRSVDLHVEGCFAVILLGSDWLGGETANLHACCKSVALHVANEIVGIFGVGNDFSLALHLPLQSVNLGIQFAELTFIRTQLRIFRLLVFEFRRGGVIGGAHGGKSRDRAVPGAGEDHCSNHEQDADSRWKWKFVEFAHDDRSA